MHLPEVDGETGAITILLGLEGGDHHEVRLAVSAQCDAQQVIDESIQALVVCRDALGAGR